MKHKNTAWFLAFTLAAAAPLFADTIPGHSRGGSKYVTFSEGFTSQQNGQGSSAECNFLLGAPKANGLSTNSIAGSPSAGIAATGASVKFVDFSGNNGASSDMGKGKGKGKGKQGGGSGNGNGTTSGGGTTAPLIAVAEPGSRSLLLFGLAGLSMLVFRRKTFTNAI
jgi:hypothetical protein